MNRIIMSLEIPSINKEYEIQVPQSVTVCELVEMIAKSVESLSGYHYNASGTELLCIKERNCIMNPKHKVGNYSLRNGEHLVLF